MKGNPINKKKLTGLISVPIFLFICVYLDAIPSLKSIDTKWIGTRFQHAAESYAAAKSTTVEALHAESYKAWQAGRLSCEAAAKDAYKLEKTDIFLTTEQEYVTSRCAFYPGVIALPKDNYQSYLAGLWGVLSLFLLPLTLAFLSIITSICAVYVLPSGLRRLKDWIYN